MNWSDMQVTRKRQTKLPENQLNIANILLLEKKGG